MVVVLRRCCRCARPRPSAGTTRRRPVCEGPPPRSLVPPLAVDRGVAGWAGRPTVGRARSFKTRALCRCYGPDRSNPQLLTLQHSPVPRSNQHAPHLQEPWSRGHTCCQGAAHGRAHTAQTARCNACAKEGAAPPPPRQWRRGAAGGQRPRHRTHPHPPAPHRRTHKPRHSRLAGRGSDSPTQPCRRKPPGSSHRRGAAAAWPCRASPSCRQSSRSILCGGGRDAPGTGARRDSQLEEGGCGGGKQRRAMCTHGPLKSSTGVPQRFAGSSMRPCSCRHLM